MKSFKSDSLFFFSLHCCEHLSRVVLNGLEPLSKALTPTLRKAGGLAMATGHAHAAGRVCVGFPGSELQEEEVPPLPRAPFGGRGNAEETEVLQLCSYRHHVSRARRKRR